MVFVMIEEVIPESRVHRYEGEAKTYKDGPSHSSARAGGFTHPSPITLYRRRNNILPQHSGPVILFSMILHQGRECIRFPGM